MSVVLKFEKRGDFKLKQLVQGLYFKFCSLSLPTFQVFQEKRDMNGNLELNPFMIASQL